MESHTTARSPEDEQGTSSILDVAVPKPPTPQPTMQVIAIQNTPTLSDPPPPYPSRERRTRARTRRAAQVSGESSTGQNQAGETPQRLSVDPLTYSQYESSPMSPEDGMETTPLLSPRTRQRRLSTSTGISTHSLSQTVLSLFQEDSLDIDTEERNFDRIEDGDDIEGYISNGPASPNSRSLKRYFRPVWRIAYYLPIFHLLFVNFAYGLIAFVYLFVGTLTGTALLLALPLGAVLCWLTLTGGRTLAKGEIAIQNYFHGPLQFPSPMPSYPIFSRPNQIHEDPESGASATPVRQSFLKNTYVMFTDQTSYQAIFYFLVIKPSITLLLTISLSILVPVALVLVIPAPAMLRAVKRIGVWQANIAVEGLLQPRL